MSWSTDIYSVMTADASIVAATEGIYYEKLPDNSDLGNNVENGTEFKDFIMFTYNKSKITSTTSIREFNSDYTLSVMIISKSPARLATLSDQVITYLQNKTTSNIGEISFLNETKSKDLEIEIYENTIDFKVFYNN